MRLSSEDAALSAGCGVDLVVVKKDWIIYQEWIMFSIRSFAGLQTSKEDK
jgi:hypothetical protein